jgi:hypothetical protein
MGAAGASTAAPAGGLLGFGSTPAPAPASTSLFGAASAAPPAGGFLGAATPAASGTSLFGGLGGMGAAGASTAAPAGGLLGFGSTPASTSMFGAPPAGGLFSAANPAAAGTSAFGGIGVVAAFSSDSTQITPRRNPRSLQDIDFLKEFLGPIEGLIESRLAENKMRMNEASGKNEKKVIDDLQTERKSLEQQLRKQSIRFSDAIQLHQEHVNQCKSILRFCGAKEQQVKEEKSLKTDLDNDFDKYSWQTDAFFSSLHHAFAGCNRT